MSSGLLDAQGWYRKVIADYRAENARLRDDLAKYRTFVARFDEWTQILLPVQEKEWLFSQMAKARAALPDDAADGA